MVEDYSKYKYRLREILGKLPLDISKSKKKILQAEISSRTTFQIDCNILINQSRNNISTERLLIYAEVLDCTVDDLISEKLKEEIQKPLKKYRD